jgi:hypothetical protein
VRAQVGAWRAPIIPEQNRRVAKYAQPSLDIWSDWQGRIRAAPSFLHGCTSKVALNEFEAGEEIANFERGRFGCVGAVRAVIADAGAEVMANGAGGCFFGVGGAHGLAPFQDGAFGFEDQDENLAGAHEFAKLAEKGALFMNGVKACGFAVRKDRRFDRNDAETGLVNAGEYFSLKIAHNGVWLDDCESSFDCQE